MRTLQYLQKKFNLFFAHENLKKQASKVAHNRSQTFFHSTSPAAQTSPELIFHIINMSQDSSVSLSVVLKRGQTRLKSLSPIDCTINDKSMTDLWQFDICRMTVWQQPNDCLTTGYSMCALITRFWLQTTLEYHPT